MVEWEVLTTLFGTTFVVEFFGSQVVTGIFLLILFSSVLYKAGLGFDGVIVVFIPLLTSMALYGYIPFYINGAVFIAMGVIWYMVLKKLRIMAG